MISMRPWKYKKEVILVELFAVLFRTTSSQTSLILAFTHPHRSSEHPVNNHQQAIQNPPLDFHNMTSLVWLITGATSGIGAALVEHVVARGDRVIATGRNVEKRLGHLKLEGLRFLELDITSSLEDIRAQAALAWEIFGHIDVVMNNAGMSAMKSAEEAE